MRTFKSRTIMIALAAILCISTVIGATYTYTYTYASQAAEDENSSAASSLDEIDIRVSYFDEAAGEWVRMLEVEELKLRTAQQENPLFQNVGFEPGKMVVRQIKIENAGANMMDYGVKFVRTEEPSGKDLAEVIEVYTGAAEMKNDKMTSPASRSDVLATESQGKLKELFGKGNFVQGTLASGGTQYAYVALYMPQNVDNTYQSASAGAFSITWGAGDAYSDGN